MFVLQQYMQFTTLSIVFCIDRVRMYNFFQSPLRKDIKTIVYGEDSFAITLFDKEYFGVKKSKSLWPWSLSWYQVLGVELPTNNIPWVADQVAKVYHDYRQPRNNISFQRGVVNEILRFYNVSHRSPEFAWGMRETRLQLQHWIQQETWLIPSFRENMPLATVLIDVTKSDEELLHDMNSGAKSHVRKSQWHNLTFRTADPKDYERFYEEWIKIAGFKWFHIIPLTTYRALMDYLTSNHCGNIFMVEKDGVILWGSIAVYDQETITYLYGFSNRDPRYKNIWVHQFIKYQMFWRARERGLHRMDLFGGAPTGFDEHPLTSVSKFKESLWWVKLERYGNYDIILNPRLYKAFYFHHRLKKK